MKNNYAIIMAGGRGERFWPMSTAARPKQLLRLAGDRPMLAESVRRLQPLIPPEQVIIVTNAELAPAIREIMPEFPQTNIIGEPRGRNTAPAIALGAAIIQARAPEAVMAVLTADHVIGGLDIFRQTLADAMTLAARQDALLTIGIPPASPSIGFGYLETGAPRRATAATEFFEVTRFVEKPDADTANRYLQAGNYYWNSGMFVWSLASFKKAAQRHYPELTALMHTLEPAIGRPEFTDTLEQAYKTATSISIDYAIMEKAQNIIMARGRFQWDDVGSWSAIEKHFPADQSGNVVIGRAVTVDAKRNIVMADDRDLVALVGVENLVVVRHGDATLICPKDRDQDVKKIVEQLRRSPDAGRWL